MEKSKLGISTKLLGALLFFIAASNNMFVVTLAVGYVLLRETDDRLRKTAVKVLIMSVFFSILILLVNFLGVTAAQFISAIYSWSMSWSGTGLLDRIYRTVINMPHTIQITLVVVQAIIFVIFGFKAYKQKDIKIKSVDNIIDKNF